MKKQRFILAMLTTTLVLSFAGCETANSFNGENSGGYPLDNQQLIDDGVSFNATIIEIQSAHVLVEPLVSEFFPRSGDRVSFETGNLAPIDISVGDTVTIWFDGHVMESYPVQIAAISWALLQTNTEPKSISITGIQGAAMPQRAFDRLFAELPSSLALPRLIAFHDGYITGPTFSGDLMVPGESTLDGSPAWKGNGDYYIQMTFEISEFQHSQAIFFTNGGETPVKVSFNQARTTLEIGKFKVWSPE